MAPHVEQDHNSRVFTIEVTTSEKPAIEEAAASVQVRPQQKTNWINLVLLGVTQLLGGLTFSLLSSFYTEEATKKGLSVTQSGVVSL